MKIIEGKSYYKISELSQITGVTKHTIQFYNKNKLLPNTINTAKNMIYYPEITITVLNLIKYMKEELSYSIENIIHVFEGYKIDFYNREDLIISSLEILTYGLYDMENKEVIDNIDKAIKLKVVDDKKYYFKKEVEIVHIMNKLLDYNIGEKLIKEYIEHAQKIAFIEKQFADKAFEESGRLPEKEVLDIVNKFKPFVFNKETTKVFKGE